MNLVKWAQAVKERDNWTCRECGTVADEIGRTYIHAHHINPRSQGGKNTMSNGRTLCLPCHTETHDGERAKLVRLKMHPRFKEAFLRTQLRLVDDGVVKRLTLRRVSEETGVYYQRLREYALGQAQTYSVKHLVKLCEFFHCQPADIIYLDR